MERSTEIWWDLWCNDAHATLPHEPSYTETTTPNVWPLLPNSMKNTKSTVHPSAIGHGLLQTMNQPQQLMVSSQTTHISVPRGNLPNWSPLQLPTFYCRATASPKAEADLGASIHCVPCSLIRRLHPMLCMTTGGTLIHESCTCTGRYVSTPL